MTDTTTPAPAEALERLADATVGARRFLDSVKPRTLKTDKGRVVTTREVAESLVKRADLEHAVVKGKRPNEILCADCKAPVKVPRSGTVPTRCGPHQEEYRKAYACAKAKRHREARRSVDPDGERAKERERSAKWRGNNRDRLRERGRRRYADNIEARREKSRTENQRHRARKKAASATPPAAT